MFAKLNDSFCMIHAGGIQLRDVLAANLRRLRIARHLSLSELARATAMSKATLSGIENARANPTVETLAALADALRVPIGELLEELPVGELRVVRAGVDPVAAPDGIARRLLDGVAPSGSIEVSELTLPPRRFHEVQPVAPGSRAHVYVIEGKLIAGPVERTTELTAGDYASFPADTPHVYETLRQGARVLLLSQGPA
jgi:transcriptional regulator with XRE-family HTH domain